ncbi:hypothetical protein [Dyadobacter psychrotolerans]|uniref:Uncharacterized protein n=1 Tax=Dyadobacter psychrotolerans TaxID=2541721 RepID=A0A4R5DC73_9BACT|nr:hypothetical protein [Dyadobacter psychrotolerans]TDE11322.1 hypothetical protein E0F88_25760 [Dyadobacter psychrotolerans]
MIHEKIFNLAVDREAKVILKGGIPNISGQITIDFEFLIKEKNDRYFRSPIGENHPQYWKLKRLSPERSQLLQLEYSGLSKKQLNAAIKEFKQLAGLGYVFNDSIRIEERMKGLKGIRSNVTGRSRVLAA